MKLIAIVPAYNEGSRIQVVLQRLAKHVSEIIVVNDGSKDDTSEQVLTSNQPNTILLENVINMGKGATARTGCDYAINERGATHIVLVDGDGQHEPDDIPKFLAIMKKKKADIVFGLRKRTNDMPPIFRLGNWGLSLLSRILFRISIQDTQCGYRLMTKEAYKKVRWLSNDYAMESEMIARSGLHRLRHKQILIKTIYHDAYKGTGVIDGIKIGLRLMQLRVMLWQR